MVNQRARELRRDASFAEAKLWAAVRNRRLGGYKFRRQQRIGPYIVDFVCHEARLAIELDGGQHATADETVRTARLEADGYRVLRFWNNEVLDNFEGAPTAIAGALRRRNPSPTRR